MLCRETQTNAFFVVLPLNLPPVFSSFLGDFKIWLFVFFQISWPPEISEKVFVWKNTKEIFIFQPLMNNSVTTGRRLLLATSAIMSSNSINIFSFPGLYSSILLETSYILFDYSMKALGCFKLFWPTWLEVDVWFHTNTWHTHKSYQYLVQVLLCPTVHSFLLI